MKKLGIFALIFILPGTCWAQEHLDPEPSLYGGDVFMSDYDSLVTSVLHDAYGPKVVLRMIANPSFEPEYAVGLKKDSGKYEVFYLRPKVQLWGYKSLAMLKDGEIQVIRGNAKKDISDLQSQLPGRPEDVKISSCHVSLAPQYGDRIVAVWDIMLRATKYPDEFRMGADGIVYHFSMRAKIGLMAGQTWTPAPDSPPGMLADIAGAMWDYCDKPDAASLSVLDTRVSRLASKLN